MSKNLATYARISSIRRIPSRGPGLHFIRVCRPAHVVDHRRRVGFQRLELMRNRAPCRSLPQQAAYRGLVQRGRFRRRWGRYRNLNLDIASSGPRGCGYIHHMPRRSTPHSANVPAFQHYRLPDFRRASGRPRWWLDRRRSEPRADLRLFGVDRPSPNVSHPLTRSADRHPPNLSVSSSAISPSPRTPC